MKRVTKEDRQLRLWRVALIDANGEWCPVTWQDFPASGQIVSMQPVKSRQHGIGTVHSFNARQAGQQQPLWAVLLSPRADRLAPGDTCYRQISLFDAG